MQKILGIIKVVWSNNNINNNIIKINNDEMMIKYRWYTIKMQDILSIIRAVGNNNNISNNIN